MISAIGRLKTSTKVLAEISADGIPQPLVLNKTDLAGLPGGIERDEMAIFMQCAYLRSLAKVGRLARGACGTCACPSFLAGPAYDIHDTSETHGNE